MSPREYDKVVKYLTFFTVYFLTILNESIFFMKDIFQISKLSRSGVLRLGKFLNPDNKSKDFLCHISI